MREINQLSVHLWLRSAIPDAQQPTFPIGFLFLKLPPPPCAVLLVQFICTIYLVDTHICIYTCNMHAVYSIHISRSEWVAANCGHKTHTTSKRPYLPHRSNSYRMTQTPHGKSHWHSHLETSCLKAASQFESPHLVAVNQCGKESV